MSKKIDVNVNMTMEVDDEDWSAAVLTMDKAAADYLAEMYLNDFDIPIPGGHAWVCSVDGASLLPE